MEATAELPCLRCTSLDVVARERGHAQLGDVGEDVVQVARRVLARTDEADGERGRHDPGRFYAASRAASAGRRLREARSPRPAARQRSRYWLTVCENQRRADALPRASAERSRDPAARTINGSSHSALPAIPTAACSERSRYSFSRLACAGWCSRWKRMWETPYAAEGETACLERV